MIEDVRQRRTFFWLVVFLSWTVVGLYFASQAYFNPAVSDGMTWTRALAVNLTYYYFWGLGTPVIMALARRYRLEAGQWFRSLCIHLLASALLTAIILIIAELTIIQFFDFRPYPIREALIFAFRVNFHSGVPTYWVVLFGYYAFDYYAKFRDRELKASQLEARLSEARLQALRMQLRPHFLFNTLNSISSLMYSDVETADIMITRLGEFLRLTIESDGKQEIGLRQELDFVGRYLEIEQIRFDRRLQVEVRADADTLEARVPSMLLQPIVENAIRHGIAPREAGGKIEIAAFQENGILNLSVCDDGPGIAEAAGPPRLRVGLNNTRERLEQLYGRFQELRMEDQPGGGVRVTITIPFKLLVPAQ